MKLGLWRALLCTIALAWIPGLAHAQFVFDPVNYTALIDANAPDARAAAFGADVFGRPMLAVVGQRFQPGRQ